VPDRALIGGRKGVEVLLVVAMDRIIRNTVVGGPGADMVSGLDNDDILIGGPGTDLTDAGTGTGTVSYADHFAPLAVRDRCSVSRSLR
jgi:hypothetical protein